MRVVRYLITQKCAILAVVCLLLVQAFCDLALPTYTADIVDVGIQQSGIESSVPEYLTQDTFETICMMLSPQDEEQLRSYYDQQDDVFVLNKQGKQDTNQIESLVKYPLVICQYASQSDDFDLDQARQAYAAGIVSKDDIAQEVQAVSEQLDQMSESIVDQQAIAAVKAEYEACGIDMGQKQLNYLISVGLRMLGVTLVGALAAAAVSFLASRTGAKIARDLRERLFARVVSFSDAEIQKFSAASLITRGTNDIQQIQMVCVMVMRMILYAPILAIGGIIMVMRTSSSMAWVIVLAVALVLALVSVLMQVALPKFRIMQTLIDKVNLVSRELITGLPVIRAFNRQRLEEERFDEANLDLKRTQLFTNRVMAFMQPSMMLIMNGISVLIVWVGAGYIDQGIIQTGDMIALITYSMVIIASFLIMSMVAVFLPRAEVAAGRINEVISTEPSILDPAESLDAQIGEGEGLKVAFNDVGFTYADASQPVLEHISFTAEPGKTTALIGATGSGKSTVLRLITRAYDVSEGSITIDGIDIRELSQHTLRSLLGYVPQRAFLFSGTIESNVGYGKEDLSEDALWHALDIAQAKDFVENKEEGLATAVSQGGTDVSGGQRQRLAIARALATDARVFLFDDSFSALDYRTDTALRSALNRELGGKTIIIVAQRISTIRNADNIVVLDEGRIVGQGTHKDLMASCPEYREIAYSQLSPEELEGGVCNE